MKIKIPKSINQLEADVGITRKTVVTQTDLLAKTSNKVGLLLQKCKITVPPELGGGIPLSPLPAAPAYPDFSDTESIATVQGNVKIPI